MFGEPCPESLATTTDLRRLTLHMSGLFPTPATGQSLLPPFASSSGTAF